VTETGVGVAGSEVFQGGDVLVVNGWGSATKPQKPSSELYHSTSQTDQWTRTALY